jgi:hypothetical protein
MISVVWEEVRKLARIIAGEGIRRWYALVWLRTPTLVFLSRWDVPRFLGKAGECNYLDPQTFKMGTRQIILKVNLA